MKCDELESFTDETFGDGKCEVYDAVKVDAAIAELKQKIAEKESWVKMLGEGEKALSLELEKTKKKLEDAKATAYAESVDAGMENRRLKRALWLARAEWARSSALSYHLIESHPDKDAAATYKRKANKWEKVKDKCLKKAEEYK